MRTTFPSSTQCCYGLKLFMCDPKQHEKIRWWEMTIFHLVMRQEMQSKPINTDTEGATESVHINRVSVLSGLNLEKM